MPQVDCSTCDDTYKVCIVCDQSELDCVCDEADIEDYLEEEEIEPDDFEQFKGCPSCGGD